VALISLDIPAGVVNHGTDFDSEGRWRDVNLVRWEQNSLRPIGGWQERTATVNVSVSTITALQTTTLLINTSTPHGLVLADQSKKITLSGFGVGSVSSLNLNDRAYDFTVSSTTALLINLTTAGLVCVQGETFDATSAIIKKTLSVTLTDPSAARGALSWTDNTFNKHIAAGTYNKLYHISSIGVVSDITPTATSITAGGVSAAAATSTTVVQVTTSTAHNLQEGNVVTLALFGAGSTSSVDINGSYIIANIAATTFEITKSGLTNSETFAHGSATISKQGFPAGQVNSGSNQGFGGYYYGLDNYGTPRPANSINIEVTTWSVGNFGQNLIACGTTTSSAQGRIYEWTLNAAIEARTLLNAPTAKSILVTDDRFLFALAANSDPRKIAWCDREDNTSWTAAATNEAGDYTLNSSGQILCGVNVRGRVLILTSTDAHIGSYAGPPVVYGFEQVGHECGIISRHAATAIKDGAFWMSYNGFFAYDGSSVQEVPCSVNDYVFEDINRAEISKVVSVENSQFNEIWWLYPSGSSLENDRYVAYNYKDNYWNIGQLDRTALIDVGVYTNPIYFDALGNIYDHETNFSHGSSTPYAETGPIKMGEGDNVISVKSLIPDEKTQGDVNVTFKTRYFPQGSEESHGPFTLANPTSVRFQGKQMRYRVNGVNLVNWKVGKMRIDTAAGSKR